MLLARLAVASAWQRIDVGKGLLKDAIERTLQAADIVGIRGIAVHARDEEARKYYEQFDFAPSLSDPMHLIALLKDIRGSTLVLGRCGHPGTPERPCWVTSPT
jgi:hypothetical protein